MAFTDIHVGDYGWAADLTVKEDGTVINISGYSTQQMLITDPSGNTATKSASFKTNGTDGILTYTIASGDIDEAGVWSIQARVSKTGPNEQITSNKLYFAVLP